jgi:hypothetical protein
MLTCPVNILPILLEKKEILQHPKTEEAYFVEKSARRGVEYYAAVPHI